MNKLLPNQPFLLTLYGYPGSGKTYFARQFCDEVQAAHLEQDRIRYELFENPRFSKQENYALNRISEFMIGEFLSAGISVVFDMNAMRLSQRMSLRELARQHKAKPLLMWFQVDPDSAFIRNEKRDRRKNDDRWAVGYDVEQFRQIAGYMQNPEPTEDFVVVSGKHTYASQLSGVMRKLAELDVIKRDQAASKMVKPELVNLIPQQPHQEPSEPGQPPRPIRRNIVLR